MSFYHSSNKSGFTLIEVLVGVAIFVSVSTLVIGGFVKVVEGNKKIQSRVAALNLLNEELEIIRNIAFDNIGVINSVPDGPLERVKTLELDGYQFIATTTVTNIDNEQDGTLGGSPNDEFPIDSKLVEIEIDCDNCQSFSPIVYSKYFYPDTLEDLEGVGAIEIKVFDAFGEPLVGADIHIENNQQSPAIVIDDETDTNGILRLIGLATGTEAYEITVTKSGYSTDRTYATGDPSNPSPNKTHITVLDDQFSQISFSIDELSTLNLETLSENCSALGNVDVQIVGSKQIGYQTYKYDEVVTTNSSGKKIISDIEWDTYSFSSPETSVYLAGSNPNSEMEIAPNVFQNMELIFRSADPNALMIQVVDSGTRLPLSDALVTLKNPGGSTIDTLTTGIGSLSQTDWSGGPGQNDFTNETKFLSQDGNIDISNPSGEFKLVQVGGVYVSDGWIESSTFDTGTTSQFHNIVWEPASQTSETGVDSVRFQVASADTNTATTTWDYIGPDGTNGSYYTSDNQTLHSSHSNNRYFRYKTFLSTENNSFTPNISDVGFVYSSNCIPTGEVLFDGLSTGSDFEVNVSKSGYDTKVDFVDIASGWQMLRVLLTEQ